MRQLRHIACGLGGLLALSGAWAQDATGKSSDPIADYQADLSAGAVSAGEIIGLAASAVSTLQSPKDFVTAVNALNSDSGKAGVGLSITPARTRFAPVSIADYATKLGSRAWAGTAFSFARNINTQGGVDYQQEAYAVHMSFYWNADDDPAVAGYKAFQNCPALRSAGDNRAGRLLEIIAKLRAEGVAAEVINDRAKQLLAKEGSFADKALPLYKACVDAAIDEAKAKWNATQFAFTLGEGHIRSPAAGSPRLSLGRLASVSVALGPNTDSLVNVTLRRTARALDVNTIATTPVYKTSTLAGARYTYRSQDLKNLYAVAEVSNARESAVGTSAIFKRALGVDYRLSEGMWIELRVGRNRTQDGKAEQTTSLMSLKISPNSKLAP